MRQLHNTPSAAAAAGWLAAPRPPVYKRLSPVFLFSFCLATFFATGAAADDAGALAFLASPFSLASCPLATAPFACLLPARATPADDEEEAEALAEAARSSSAAPLGCATDAAGAAPLAAAALLRMACTEVMSRARSA